MGAPGAVLSPGQASRTRDLSAQRSSLGPPEPGASPRPPHTPAPPDSLLPPTPTHPAPPPTHSLQPRTLYPPRASHARGGETKPVHANQRHFASRWSQPGGPAYCGGPHDGPSLTTKFSVVPATRETLSRSGRSEAENPAPSPYPIPMEMFRAALRPHSCTEALAQGVPPPPRNTQSPGALLTGWEAPLTLTEPCP